MRDSFILLFLILLQQWWHLALAGDLIGTRECTPTPLSKVLESQYERVFKLGISLKNNLQTIDSCFFKEGSNSLALLHRIITKHSDEQLIVDYWDELELLVRLVSMHQIRCQVTKHASKGNYFVPSGLEASNKAVDKVMSSMVHLLFEQTQWCSWIFKANAIDLLTLEHEEFAKKWSFGSEVVLFSSAFALDLIEKFGFLHEEKVMHFSSVEEVAELVESLREELVHYSNLPGGGGADFILEESKFMPRSTWKVKSSLSAEAYTEEQCASPDYLLNIWNNQAAMTGYKYQLIDSTVGLVIGWIQDKILTELKNATAVYLQISQCFKTWLGNLSTYKKVELNPKAEDQVDCSICMDTKDALSMKKLPCGHEFHVECIDKWLGISMTCPACRRSFKEVLNERHENFNQVKLKLVSLIDREVSYVFYGFVHQMQQKLSSCQLWDLCLCMNRTLKMLKRNFLHKLKEAQENVQQSEGNTQALMTLNKYLVALADEGYDYHYFTLDRISQILGKPQPKFIELFQRKKPTEKEYMINSTILWLDYNKLAF